MKHITIYFLNGQTIDFIGMYLPDMEKPNWHYYKTNLGKIIHCRKDYMVYVIESNQEEVLC